MSLKHATSPFENKQMQYFQRGPFAPGAKGVPANKNMPMNFPHHMQQPTSSPFDGSNRGPESVFDCIDPLDWVSLPDLFFGDQNYQNMLPSLEISNAPEGTQITTLDPNMAQSALGQNPQAYGRGIMQPRNNWIEKFPPEKVNDFKHVIYNLLVDNHNNPHKSNFVQPCTIEENGVIRHGFCFNEAENPEKKLPELYAQHIRKARLDQEDISSVFVHDLYKFYLRASVELLSKYFEKRDKYTYLYEDTPLFIPNDTLEHAEERIRNMKTRARKKRKMLAQN